MRRGRDAADIFAGRGRLARDYWTAGVDQCDSRAPPALASEDCVTPVAREVDEHLALRLRIELGAEVLDVTFAIDQMILDRGLCAEEARGD